MLGIRRWGRLRQVAMQTIGLGDVLVESETVLKGVNAMGRQWEDSGEMGV